MTASSRFVLALPFVPSCAFSDEYAYTYKWNGESESRHVVVVGGWELGRRVSLRCGIELRTRPVSESGRSCRGDGHQTRGYRR